MATARTGKAAANYFSPTSPRAGFNRDLKASYPLARKAAGVAAAFRSQTLIIAEQCRDGVPEDSQLEGIAEHAIAASQALDAAAKAFQPLHNFLAEATFEPITDHQRRAAQEIEANIDDAIKLRVALLPAMRRHRGKLTFTVAGMGSAWSQIMAALRGEANATIADANPNGKRRGEPKSRKGIGGRTPTWSHAVAEYEKWHADNPTQQLKAFLPHYRQRFPTRSHPTLAQLRNAINYHNRRDVRKVTPKGVEN